MNRPLPPPLPSSLTPEFLAQAVREELDSTGMSEREIEVRTGISRHTLARRISAGTLSEGNLIAIARLLGVRLSELCARAERKLAS